MEYAASAGMLPRTSPAKSTRRCEKVIGRPLDKVETRVGGSCSPNLLSSSAPFPLECISTRRCSLPARNPERNSLKGRLVAAPCIYPPVVSLWLRTTSKPSNRRPRKRRLRSARDCSRIQPPLQYLSACVHAD